VPDFRRKKGHLKRQKEKLWPFASDNYFHAESTAKIVHKKMMPENHA
jgi:hypothetical protein